MTIIKRRDNETDFMYKVRLCVMKLDKDIDLDWSEIAEILGLDVSSDHLRKLAYAYFEYYSYLMENGNNDSENDMFEELELKMREFEKEKIKMQDQKREYRKYLREDARWEHIEETIKDEVSKVNKDNPLSSRLTGLSKVNSSNREAILVLSDWHIGMDIDSYWNVFNIDVAKDRASHIVDKTIQYCDEQGVDTLHIDICGDMIAGLIHVNARIENSENAIQQTMIVSEMLSDMVNELSVCIPNIKIYNTQGNHGRCVADFKQSVEVENFEKLIDWYMKPRLKDCENVFFMDSLIDDEIIEINIFDKKIYSVHGHRDNIGNVITKMIQMTKTFPEMVILGHFHKDYQTEDFDTTLMVNGSFCGMDQYARSKRLNNIPHQKLIIFDEDCGQLCTYKIRLNEV